MAGMRIVVGLKRRGKPAHKTLIADAYNASFRHPAAMRYFRKRIAELFRELNGTVVIEDPPESN